MIPLKPQDLSLRIPLALLGSTTLPHHLKLKKTRPKTQPEFWENVNNGGVNPPTKDPGRTL
jgi:hypothetical protein